MEQRNSNLTGLIRRTEKKEGDHYWCGRTQSWKIVEKKDD